MIKNSNFIYESGSGNQNIDLNLISGKIDLSLFDSATVTFKRSADDSGDHLILELNSGVQITISDFFNNINAMEGIVFKDKFFCLNDIIETFEASNDELNTKNNAYSILNHDTFACLYKQDLFHFRSDNYKEFSTRITSAGGQVTGGYVEEVTFKVESVNVVINGLKNLLGDQVFDDTIECKYFKHGLSGQPEEENHVITFRKDGQALGIGYLPKYVIDAVSKITDLVGNYNDAIVSSPEYVIYSSYANGVGLAYGLSEGGTYILGQSLTILNCAIHTAVKEQNETAVLNELSEKFGINVEEFQGIDNIFNALSFLGNFAIGRIGFTPQGLILGAIASFILPKLLEIGQIMTENTILHDDVQELLKANGYIQLNDNYMGDKEQLYINDYLVKEGITYREVAGGEDLSDAIARTEKYQNIINAQYPSNTVWTKVLTSGSSGADVIYGMYGGIADEISGNDGDDVIYGYGGDDELNGGAGDDVILGGTGIDVLRGEGGNDNLYGGEGKDYLWGGSGEDILFGGSNIDYLHGSSGNDYLYGEDGDDQLYGEDGNDYLRSGKNNDKLYGGQGSDTYYFGKGDGKDIITEDSSDLASIDTIVFDSAVKKQHLYFSYGTSQNDLLIKYGDTDEILIKNFYAGANTNTIEKIQVEGIEYNINELINELKVNIIEGTDGDDNYKEIVTGGTPMGIDDSLYGTAEADKIYGLRGSDDLYGKEGNDFLFGNENDDKLYGGAGEDYLEGGRGDDRLYGEQGADTYYFSGHNFGNDTIHNYNYDGVKDKIHFSGFSFDEIEVWRDGNNLVIEPKYSITSSVTIKDYYNTNGTENRYIGNVIFETEEEGTQTVDISEISNLAKDKSLYEKFEFLRRNPELDLDTYKVNGKVRITDYKNTYEYEDYKTVVNKLNIADTEDVKVFLYRNVAAFVVGSKLIGVGYFEDGFNCIDSSMKSVIYYRSSGVIAGDYSQIKSYINNDGVRNSEFDEYTDVVNLEMKNRINDEINLYDQKIEIEQGSIQFDLVFEKNTPLPIFPPIIEMEEIKPIVDAAETQISPIILDLDGNGVKTTSVLNSVYFDHDANGFAEKSGWVDVNDGLLVRDINGNEIIDSGRELFGDNTLLKNGSKAVNGFAALSEYDDNKDGKINSSDEIFQQLKIWKDVNLDGISQVEELYSLSELGVKELNLSYDSTGTVDENGNTLIAKGSYTKEDGSVLEMSDYLFKVKLFDTVVVNDADISEEIRKLPNIRSIGSLKSLHESMQEDNELKTLVSVFTNNPNYYNLDNQLEEILFQWVECTDADIHIHDRSDGHFIDGRKIKVLEKILGEIYSNTYDDSLVGPLAGSRLTNAYSEFFKQFKAIMLYEGHLKEIFSTVYTGKDEYDRIMSYDFSTTVEYFVNLLSERPEDGLLKLQLFNVYITENSFKDNGSYVAFKEVMYEYSYLLDGLFVDGTSLDGTSLLDAVFSNSKLLIGTENDDQLIGADRNDLFVGNAGNDYLEGKDGSDIYVFRRGFGKDIINDYSNNSYIDTIIFKDINADEIEFAVDQNDYNNLLIKVKDTEDVITIKAYFSSINNRIESIEFSDGTVLNGEALQQKTLVWNFNGTEENDIIYGSNAIDASDTFSGLGGDDQFYGGSGNDTLDGGIGNDYLDGGDGSDIYIFSKGFGQDTIIDIAINSSKDIIEFTDINKEEIEFAQEQNDLIIKVLGTDDQLRIKSYTLENKYRIEEIVFADGTILSLDTIKDQLLNLNVSGTEGNDTLEGSRDYVGTDEIHGLGGDDIINGNTGDDKLYGDGGNDTIYGGSGIDVLEGGEGNDVLYGESGNDTYIFGRGYGIDTVSDYDSTTGNLDTLRMLEGIAPEDITVTRNGDNLELSINDTSDKVVISNYFNTNNYYIVEKVQFADGTEWDYNYIREAALRVTEGNDLVRGYESDDSIASLGGDDTVYGYGGSDTLDGGSGNDTIYGGYGDDTLIGSEGSDTLYGERGNDTYIFGRGYGVDTISDSDSTIGNLDTLRMLEGIAPEDITVTRNGDNLELSINDTSDKVVISNYFNTNNYYIVEKIQFADGTEWDYNYIREAALRVTEGNDLVRGYESDDSIASLGGDDTVYGNGGNDTLEGGAGNDSIYGGYGDDILRGEAGNDYLEGGFGSDVYEFSKGFGKDTIYDYAANWSWWSTNYDTGTDKIKFNDILSSEITWAVSETSGSDLVLKVAGTEDAITLRNYFSDTHARIESIEFGDGEVWDSAVLEEKLKTLIKNGTELNDTIYGANAAEFVDEIHGLGGHDTIYGNAGDDKLYGDEGDDTIYGDYGNDTLIGSEGNDVLYGERGNDTYIFGRGYGVDTISDYDSTTGNLDTLRMLEGIAPGDITVTRNGDNLELSINDTSDKVVISNYFNTNTRYIVEKVQFADGTEWDYDYIKTAALRVTEGNDVVRGYESDDSIASLGGDDTVYGYGGNDTLDGGSGNDTVYGGYGDDILIGSEGSDVLYGERGNDTYIFGRGYGVDTISDSDSTTGNLDTLRMLEGIAPGDITVTRNGDNLELSINDTSEKVVISNYFSTNNYYIVEKVQFADGTEWDYNYIKTAALRITEGNDVVRGYESDDSIASLGGDDTVYGNGGNDTLDGGSGNDTIYGGYGDDTLIGNEGSDTLYGERGNDTYIFGRGYGVDTISDYDSTTSNLDTLRMLEGIAPGDITVTRNGDNLELSINDTSDKVVITNYFSTSNYYIVEKIQFADGTEWDYEYIKEAALRVTEGNDVVRGYESDDSIASLGGDDTVYGNGGNDTLDGGSGNDTIYGGYGDDTLIGSEGDDVLYGSYGNDTLIGNEGSDTLYGERGNDTYIFGRGYGVDTISDSDSTIGNLDTLRMLEGIAPEDITVTRNGDNLELSINDTSDKVVISNYFNTNNYYIVEKIQFADGTEWDYNYIREAALRVTEGNDLVRGYESDDSIASLGGDDTVYGNGGNDTLEGGAGNDSIYGGYGDDILRGEAGNDYLEGGFGSDVYEFSKGFGKDTIYDYAANWSWWSTNYDTGTDKIKFNDILSSEITWAVSETSGSDLVLKVAGTEDAITLKNYFSDTHARIESIEFGDGEVWDSAVLEEKLKTLIKNGTELNDTIYGANAAEFVDEIHGLGGDDIIYGNAGDDKMYGDEGNDTVYGGYGDDTLIGSEGNDVLYGERGNDTYIFGRGYGVDTISDYDSTINNLDTLRMLEGIAPEDITVTRNGYNLELSINDTSDKVVILNYFSTSNYYIVEKIQFADGTEWDYNYIREAALRVTEGNDVVHGYESDDSIASLGGDDTVYGYGGNDTLDGGSGNDTVDGGYGNDTLIGGEGNDTLYGDYGNDILIGSEGDDTLYGERGNDTYIFGRGYGVDTISDYDSTTGNLDILRMLEGIALEDITVTHNGDNLELSINETSDKVVISNYFNTSNYYMVEKVQFNDGTEWDYNYIREAVVKVTEGNDVVHGFESDDSIASLGGDDTVYGYRGNDTLDGGAGNDTVDGGYGNDTLLGGEGNDTLYGDYGNDTLIGSEGSDALYGERGNDTYIFGRGYGVDTISDYDSTTGNLDTLRMLEGIVPGDITVTRNGDNLELSINDTSDKVVISNYFNTSNFYIVEKIQFADGTEWDYEYIKTAALKVTKGNDVVRGYESDDSIASLGGDDTVYGNGGNDTLDGGVGNDTIYGGTGNDKLIGSEGNDTLCGDYGNDTYIFGRGYGVDTISDYDSTTGNLDTLRMLEGIVPEDITVTRNGDNLELLINDTSDKVVISNYFNTSNYYMVEKIQFADGTEWDYEYIKTAALDLTEGNDVVRGYESDDSIASLGGDDIVYGYGGNDTLDGGLGNDTIYGGTGNDTLIGSEGDDVLYGNYGNDTYIFGRGYGVDTISDLDCTAGNLDTLRMLEGIAPEDITVTHNGGNLELSINDTLDKVVISNYFNTNNYFIVEKVQFADGTEWDYNYIKEAALGLTEGNDVVRGYESDDSIASLGGDDTVYGYGGNDTLDGGLGNDTIYGGTGNDTLIGSEGSDVLHGESGNDTYIFGRGYGVDTISDYDSTTGNLDTLRMLEGIAPEDITVTRNGYNLELSINDTSDKVVISNYFSISNRYIVEKIQFADGTEWDYNYIREAALKVTEGNDVVRGYESDDSIASLGGDDTVYGYGGNDTLDGGLGNDTIYGGTGNDTLIGSEGSDVLHGESGNDTYIFGRGYGVDTISDYDSTTGNLDTLRMLEGIAPEDITVIHSGDNLELSINGTSDKVIINNYFNINNRYIVEKVQFVDGTEWDYNYIKEAALGLTEGDDVVHGYESDDSIASLGGDDTVYGNGGSDTLDGGLGNDTINGGYGDDTLIGGEGSDVLYGSYGNDTLIGSEGNDALYGERGNDTYIFGRGYGVDTISDYDSTTGNLDTLRMLEGIAPEDITVTRNGDNLELSINETSDKVVISNYFSTSNYYTVEKVQFADGTEWDYNYIKEAALGLTEGNDVVHGYESDDSIASLGGDDTVYGNGGNDTLDGGIGDDMLYGGSGDDTLEGGTGNDYLDGGSGINTYVYSVEDGSDTIAVNKDTGAIEFNWNWQARQDWNGTNWGDGGNDAFDGFGKTAITVNGVTQSLLNLGTADGTTRNITVGGVDFTSRVRFLSSNILEVYLETAPGFEGTSFSVKTGGNLGSDGSETFTEGYIDLQGRQIKYAHSVNSGGSDPNIFFVMIPEEDGTAAATYERSRDNVYCSLENITTAVRILIIPSYHTEQEIATLLENSLYGGQNILKLGEGILAEDVEMTRSGTDLIVNMATEGDQVTVANWYQGNKLDKIIFADGTEWLREEINSEGLIVQGSEEGDVIEGLNEEGDVLYGLGGADTLNGYSGNDTLYGGAGDDTLYGGDGDDILEGGAGNDYFDGGSGINTYVYNVGDGHDTIAINELTQNVLRLGANIQVEGVEIVRNGMDLIVNLATEGDSITITNWYGGSKLDRIEFADGSIWTMEEIHDKGIVTGLTVRGTEEDDRIEGLDGEGDALYGLGGADSISGYSGDDLLYGGAGDDILYGNAGNDKLEGGTGNDILDGGSGNNTYIYNVGDGHDTVIASKKMEIIPFNWNWKASQNDWYGTNWQDGGNDAFDRFGYTSVTVNGETSDLYLGSADGTVNNFTVGGAHFTSKTSFISSNILEIYLEAVPGSEDAVFSITTGGNLGSDGGEIFTEGFMTLDGRQVKYAHSEDESGYDPNIFFVMIAEGNNGEVNATYQRNIDDVYGSLDNVNFPVRILIIPSYHEPQEIIQLLENNLYSVRDTEYDLYGGMDILKMGEGIRPQDVEITRNGLNLIINTQTEGDQIIIENWYDGRKLDRIEFADGTVWTQNDIHYRGLVLNGSEMEDMLVGVYGEDNTLYGNGGDDILEGIGAGYNYL
ncbi:MAG: calcium-binding protein, partial [Bacillota bacterium]